MIPTSLDSPSYVVASTCKAILFSCLIAVVLRMYSLTKRGSSLGDEKGKDHDQDRPPYLGDRSKSSGCLGHRQFATGGRKMVMTKIPRRLWSIAPIRMAVLSIVIVFPSLLAVPGATPSNAWFPLFNDARAVSDNPLNLPSPDKNDFATQPNRLCRFRAGNRSTNV
jgi:hypothetical protein